ncbi:MAG: DUF2164 domain-containing protein [Hyphomicrobiaceae bacterium]|nr:DUF2164 domain-containing protein [Hyphomicrobiaceae bacterium]
MRVKLSDERKAEIADALVDYFAAEFDEELSAFRAASIVDFMLRQIGPSQYNQAIADARKYMAEKIDDLDAEFYEPEENGDSDRR